MPVVDDLDVTGQFAGRDLADGAAHFGDVVNRLIERQSGLTRLDRGDLGKRRAVAVLAKDSQAERNELDLAILKFDGLGC